MSGKSITMSCGARKAPQCGATITASGKIPTPKPLPKAPQLKLVSEWKPAIWDADYRLEAYWDGNRKRWCPGFVIEHSCGLSLVHPSESGELGVSEHGENVDIRQNWLLTHSALRLGIRPNAELQARNGCALVGGIISSGLDAACGSAEKQSRIPPGWLQRASGIWHSLRKGRRQAATGGIGACGMTATYRSVNRGRTSFRPPSIRPANLSGHRRRRTRSGLPS